MNLELYLESFTELNLNRSNEWIQMNGSLPECKTNN